MAALEGFPSLNDLLFHHGLVKKDLDRRYPAKIRLEIAQLLDDWKMIGYSFGFSSQKINDIKVDNDNEEQRRVALLDAWEQREGEGATYLKLAEAFHHRRRADLVDKLIVSGKIMRAREETKVLDKSILTAGINSYTYVKERLDSLEDKFSILNKQLLHVLEVKDVTADDLLDELTLLPVALRREYQESIKKEMHNVESRASRSIRHVFRLLINPLTTFLDYKLLEHLISKFGTTKLQEDMAYYVSDVNKFKHETTVAELMDHWDGIEDQSLNYSELKVRFGEDPSECTLESLDKRRRRFCSRYRLSELVMVLIHLKPGSFIAVWRIPNLNVDEMKESTGHMDNTFFDEDNIQSVSIAGKQAYPTISYDALAHSIDSEILMQMPTDQDPEEALLSQFEYETEEDCLTSRFQLLSVATKHRGSGTSAADSGIGGSTYSGRGSTTTTSSTGHSRASLVHEPKGEVMDNSKVLEFGIKGLERAPETMCSYVNGAVVSDNVVYFNPAGTKRIYAYNHTLTTNRWSRHLDCPHEKCSLAVISNLVTTVGGYTSSSLVTNKLYSLSSSSSGEKWTKKFPPMPTERWNAVSLCTGTLLVVAGGFAGLFHSNSEPLTTVEVLNTEIGQWSSIANLPQPISSASLVACDKHVYVVGRSCRSVYKCSINHLLEACGNLSSHLTAALPSPHLTCALPSSTRGSLWNRIAEVPLHYTTCVSLPDGGLIVVGGINSVTRSSTAAIHMYNATTDSWKAIGNMSIARSSCFAAVLPDNQLLIVGGRVNSPGHPSSNSVEFATFTL